MVFRTRARVECRDANDSLHKLQQFLAGDDGVVTRGCTHVSIKKVWRQVGHQLSREGAARVCATTPP